MMNVKEALQQIWKETKKNGYRKYKLFKDRVVIQLGKEWLKNSLTLTKGLREVSDEDVEYFILYDSLKEECCTDVLGAQHAGYDGLFHLGEACFSEHYLPNHHYLLNNCDEAIWEGVYAQFPHIRDVIQQHHIDLVLCEQNLYGRVKGVEGELAGAQLLKLPYHAQPHHEYFGFGYWGDLCKHPHRVLIITDGQQKLSHHVWLCREVLQVEKLFTVSADNAPAEVVPNSNKTLMQRMALVSQIQGKQVFGILVSNPSTLFCQRQIKRCRALLDRHKRKHFTLMMNNVNECKLGNFPEIEVYIMISCYNHSLYTSSHFHQLVITPYDIQIAFNDSSYQTYNFDLAIKQVDEIMVEGQHEYHGQEKKEEKMVKDISLIEGNGQVMVKDAIQTLDFYRNKEYKGLAFAEKKEVEKVKKGKIGIASEYSPLE